MNFRQRSTFFVVLICVYNLSSYALGIDHHIVVRTQYYRYKACISNFENEICSFEISLKKAVSTKQHLAFYYIVCHKKTYLIPPLLIEVPVRRHENE